jgi:NTP pyrophosphatase (non-canonical NTP hydrolase)
MINKELENLLNSLNQNLKVIQNNFEDYQNKHFVQKSSQFFCLELNGEAGELANLEKKEWKGRNVEFAKFEDEAADVFIALMNYCNSKQIDLEQSLIQKLKYIEQIRMEREQKGETY